MRGVVQVLCSRSSAAELVRLVCRLHCHAPATFPLSLHSFRSAHRSRTCVWSHVHRICAGDLLRQAVKDGDEELEAIMKEGKLVPMETTIALLKARPVPLMPCNRVDHSCGAASARAV